jgi:hypothetical protein
VFAILCTAGDVSVECTVLETRVGFAGGVFAVGDIDGDGKRDIAGGGKKRLYWIRHSSPEQKYIIASSAALGYEIHLGDVDRDGDLDVLSSGAGITWWENPLKPDGDPSAAPWPAHQFGTFGSSQNGGSHDFKVGDIDGDGKCDAVEREQNTGTWHLFMQDSPSSWREKTIDASCSGEGTCLGDIDNDGDLDLSDGWAWFECPEEPVAGIWTRHDIGDATHHLTRVVIADINNDGRRDIVSGPCEFGGSRLIWFEAPQDPRSESWTEHILSEYNDPNFHTLQVGDIDGDNHADILAGSTHGPCSVPKIVRIFFNTNGDGTTWSETTWTTKEGVWQGVLADVGSDGDLDLLTCDYSGAQSEWWKLSRESVTATGHGHFACTRQATPRGLWTVMAGGRLHGRIVDLTGRRINTVIFPRQSAGIYPFTAIEQRQ